MRETRPDPISCCEAESARKWRQRLYDENEPQRLETIFGQLMRIATNRAVFLSVFRMLQQSQINPGDVVGDFLIEGYRADLVLSLRRLLESNLQNGKLKPPDKRVNSLMGLAEYLGRWEITVELQVMNDSLADTANKIFAHNDLEVADGKKTLYLPSHNDLDSMLQRLHQIVIELGKHLGEFVDDELLPTFQYDWSECFERRWKPTEFDDSDIWGEL